ncbi:anthrone oxygenase family protein [Phycicoccus flavus]|uniref:anthrone oxygenase family protein n=1 Tax=Phycicoccus flavus TaxID=2502783 RepID=UPI00197B4FD8|nr:anthrone oxygenase family protein [Phycicoccus flavus]
MTAPLLCLGITGAVNVPLNDTLAAAGDESAVRAAFERPWTAAYLVRTAMAPGAVLAVTTSG